MTVRPLTAAEHLEAALALLELVDGHWTLTVDATDGIVRRTLAEQRAAKIAFNRDQLDAPPAVGESAA